MKAAELRIGNLVNVKHPHPKDGTYIMCVNGVDEEEIMTDAYGTYYGTCDASINDVSPIPLTKEWLIKFGWKRLDKYTFTLNGLFIYKRKRGFVTGSKKRETLLESVHDLQNWYYYNNNKKELEIK